MAKEILDIYVEQGYPYEFSIDLNTTDGVDLEPDYTAYFYNEDIGTKTFEVLANTYRLVLSSEDTGKITENLTKYVVYAVNNSTTEKDKLLTGRIVLDKKVGV